jgi:hypothetical protein
MCFSTGMSRNPGCPSGGICNDLFSLSLSACVRESACVCARAKATFHRQHHYVHPPPAPTDAPPTSFTSVCCWSGGALRCALNAPDTSLRRGGSPGAAEEAAAAAAALGDGPGAESDALPPPLLACPPDVEAEADASVGEGSAAAAASAADAAGESGPRSSCSTSRCCAA